MAASRHSYPGPGRRCQHGDPGLLVVHDALSDGRRPTVLRNIREAEIRIDAGVNREVLSGGLHLGRSWRRLRSSLCFRARDTEAAHQKKAGSECQDPQSGPACPWRYAPHDLTPFLVSWIVRLNHAERPDAPRQRRAQTQGDKCRRQTEVTQVKSVIGYGHDGPLPSDSGPSGDR